MEASRQPGSDIRSFKTGNLSVVKVKALEHPLRRQILRALHRAVRETSADELCRSGYLQSDLPRTTYHLTVLCDAELIEVADQAQRRGALVSSYRSMVSKDAEISRALREAEPADLVNQRGSRN